MTPGRRIRAALVIASAVFVAVILYLGLTFVSLVRTGHSTTRGRFDAVVVMGAAQYDGTPTPMLERRLQKALDLWNNERATWIAVTGGKKPGDRFTEAGTSAQWLIERGVPEENILFEETGRSTWESLQALRPVLAHNDVETTLIVTTDWHEARSVHTMRQLGFAAEPASAGPAQGSVSRWSRETVAVALGRIIGFGRLFRITG